MLDCSYIHFQTNTIGKGMNSIIPTAMGWIIPLLSFYKDGFDIKKTIKVNMSLNEQNQMRFIFQHSPASVHKLLPSVLQRLDPIG